MSKEAMQIALNAIEQHLRHHEHGCAYLDGIPEALRAELAQPEPDIELMAEAVHEAYLTTCDALGWGVKPENRVPYSELTEDSKELDRASVRAVLRYTAPPQREWIGLTDEELNEITWGKDIYEVLSLAEAKLKDKNGY